jgi:hypothetical protein
LWSHKRYTPARDRLRTLGNSWPSVIVCPLVET